MSLGVNLNELHIIIPENVYIAVVLAFSVVVILVRVVRWVLDVLP